MGFNLKSVSLSHPQKPQDIGIFIEQVELHIGWHNLLLKKWFFAEILVKGVKHVSFIALKQDEVLPNSVERILQQEKQKTLQFIDAIEKTIRLSQQGISEFDSSLVFEDYQGRVAVLNGLSSTELSELKQSLRKEVQHFNQQQRSSQQLYQKLLQYLRQLPNLPPQDVLFLNKKYNFNFLDYRFVNLALGDLIRQRFDSWRRIYSQYQPLFKNFMKIAQSTSVFNVASLRIYSLDGNDELAFQNLDFSNGAPTSLVGSYRQERFSTLSVNVDLLSGDTQFQVDTPKQARKNFIIVDTDYLSLIVKQAVFSERITLSIKPDKRMRGNWQQNYQSIIWDQLVEKKAAINRLMPDFLNNIDAFEVRVDLRGSIVKPVVSINSSLDVPMYEGVIIGLQEIKRKFEFDVQQILNAKVVATIQSIRKQLQQINQVNKRLSVQKQKWQKLLKGLN